MVLAEDLFAMSFDRLQSAAQKTHFDIGKFRQEAGLHIKAIRNQGFPAKGLEKASGILDLVRPTDVQPRHAAEAYLVLLRRACLHPEEITSHTPPPDWRRMLMSSEDIGDVSWRTGESYLKDLATDGYSDITDIGGRLFGTVYSARDRLTNMMVAIKIFHDRNVSDGSPYGGFFNELRLLGEIDDPHIVGLKGAGIAMGLPYLALEFLSARHLCHYPLGITAHTVADHFNEDPENPLMPLTLMRQMVAALAVVHAAGLIHRDVKPANFFLSGDWKQVKLGDFGLGIRKVEAKPRKRAIGDANYLPPEAIDRKCTDSPQQDVYALGIALYELVTDNLTAEGGGPSPSLDRLKEDLAREQKIKLRTTIQDVIIQALHPERGVPFKEGQEMLAAFDEGMRIS